MSLTIENNREDFEQPAEPMVTLYCYTQNFDGGKYWLSTPFNNLESVLKDGGIPSFNARLISFQLPRRLWDRVQPEAVEAVVTDDGEEPDGREPGDIDPMLEGDR